MLVYKIKCLTLQCSNKQVKQVEIMKAIRIYSYYSRFYSCWAHLEAYSKRDALKRARVIDPYTKLSDLSLLNQSDC